MSQRPPGHRPRHVCVAFGCTDKVPWNWLMCDRHWALVPPALQKRVYAHWNNGDPSPQWTRAAWAAARSIVKQGELFNLNDISRVVAARPAAE